MSQAHVVFKCKGCHEENLFSLEPVIQSDRFPSEEDQLNNSKPSQPLNIQGTKNHDPDDQICTRCKRNWVEGRKVKAALYYKTDPICTECYKKTTPPRPR